MKVQQAVKTETLHVALGVLAGDVLMLAVFFLLHKLDLTVFLGAVLGSAFAVLSFFLLGLSVQKITGDGYQDPASAGKYMKTIYHLRMLMMAAVIVAGVLLPCFNYIAVIVPFLFPQMAAFVFKGRSRGDGKKAAPQEERSDQERGES